MFLVSSVVFAEDLSRVLPVLSGEKIKNVGAPPKADCLSCMGPSLSSSIPNPLKIKSFEDIGEYSHIFKIVTDDGKIFHMNCAGLFQGMTLAKNNMKIEPDMKMVPDKCGCHQEEMQREMQARGSISVEFITDTYDNAFVEPKILGKEGISECDSSEFSDILVAKKELKLVKGKSNTNLTQVSKSELKNAEEKLKLAEEKFKSKRNK